MTQGPSPRRVRELARLFDIDRRTINRWRTFWREYFPLTNFWKVHRGLLVPSDDVDVLPWSLVKACVQNNDDREGWKKLLTFLSPITVTGGLKIEAAK